MHSLYQQLKELDAETFEQFCFQLLKDRHPGIDIRRVCGAGGDEGIDIFEGDLADGPTVWQAKTFPNGVRASQKNKIRNSLARVISKCSPREWVLCTNVDLDIKTHRWLQSLAPQFQLRISLMQASNMVNELIHRRTLRQQFFPRADLDVSGLRSLLMKTNQFTKDELLSLTEENASQYLQRLKERDARFNYEITVSPDQKPATSPHPNEVFAVTKGHTALRGLARDRDALRLSPPQVKLQVTPVAASKIHQFLNTGHQQQLLAGEISGLQTDLPIQEELIAAIHDLTLTLTQNPSNDVLPMRLVFGEGVDAVTYECIQFRIVRAGREELELASTSNLPFDISVVIRQKKGKFEFSERSDYRSIRDVRKFMDAIYAISRTKRLEMHDLTLGKTVFKGVVGNVGVPKHWSSGLEEYVRDLSAIADEFDIALPLVGCTSEDDCESFLTLRAITRGIPTPFESFSFQLLKGEDNEERFANVLETGINDFRCEMESFTLVLFGIAVAVGPVSIRITNAPIENLPSLREEWRRTAHGGAVTVTLGRAQALITRTIKHHN